MGRAFGLALVVAGVVCAQGALADCNKPTAQAITQIGVSGNPFSAIPTPDGCTIFVSLLAQKQSHIAVLKRDNGVISVAQTVAVEGMVGGMALSPDGKTLAATTGAGVTLLDTGKLLAGADAVVAKAEDGPHAGAIYAAFSPDGRLLVVANERSASLSVYEAAGLKSVGLIPVAGAPVGLAFSADGTRLYSTSEVGPRTWDAKCTTEGPAHAEGVLLVIDVARAATDPAKSVIGGVAAGCNTVRVALSPDSATAYATARGANAVHAFDTAKLITDPAHALKGVILVGSSPVGVAAARGKVFATNSNRFGGGTDQTVSVLDAANLSAPQGSIPAGGFPRELKVTADGNTLLVTNYTSGSVELVDLARLP